MKNRAYRRFQRQKYKKRKQKIKKKRYPSQKTRNKGKRRNRHANYFPSINYLPRDLKRIQKLNDTFIDLY